MIKKLKISLLALAFLSLIISGGNIQAAYNDVTLDAGTILVVGGMDLNVEGTHDAVESLTVEDDTFSVDLEDGSYLKVTSLDKTTFTLSPANDSNFNSTKDCGSNKSTLTLTGQGSATVTVTPTGNACTSGGSGGGGGGGGGSSSNGASVTPAVPANEGGAPSDCTPGIQFSPSTGRNCNAATPAVVCAPGQMFSASTGQKCTITSVVSCPAGQIFSALTGEKCSTTLLPPGTPSENPPTYVGGSTTLTVKLGTRGEACKVWQTYFNAHGAHLTIDGICGKLTITFAKSWQASVGLTADGILGPKSRGKAGM